MSILKTFWLRCVNFFISCTFSKPTQSMLLASLFPLSSFPLSYQTSCSDVLTGYRQQCCGSDPTDKISFLNISSFPLSYQTSCSDVKTGYQQQCCGSDPTDRISFLDRCVQNLDASSTDGSASNFDLLVNKPTM